MNAMGALGRATPGDVGALPEARALAEAVIAECTVIAQACGIGVRIEKVLATVEMSVTKHPHHMPSMRQDVEAGRPTEIDALNGAFALRAEAVGIPAPLNTVFAALVRLTEQAAKNKGAG
jgi:2-dehydropantoate 2-reductase